MKKNEEGRRERRGIGRKERRKEGRKTKLQEEATEP